MTIWRISITASSDEAVQPHIGRAIEDPLYITAMIRALGLMVEKFRHAHALIKAQ